MDISSQEKILIAAERLFAEKGFDAVSTASIAREAGVNSALIFYYYENKENLLKCILSDKMHQYRQGRSLPPDAFLEGAIKPELIDQLVKGGLEFIQSNEDVLRILLMESLKKSTDDAKAFEINHEMMTDVFRMLKNTPGERMQTNQAEWKALFFITLPMVAYTLLKSSLADYYSIPECELDGSMATAFRDAYIHMISKEFGLNVET